MKITKNTTAYLNEDFFAIHDMLKKRVVTVQDGKPARPIDNEFDLEIRYHNSKTPVYASEDPGRRSLVGTGNSWVGKKLILRMPRPSRSVASGLISLAQIAEADVGETLPVAEEIVLDVSYEIFRALAPWRYNRWINQVPRLLKQYPQRLRIADRVGRDEMKQRKRREKQQELLNDIEELNEQIRDNLGRVSRLVSKITKAKRRVAALKEEIEANR